MHVLVLFHVFRAVAAVADLALTAVFARTLLCVCAYRPVCIPCADAIVQSARACTNLVDTPAQRLNCTLEARRFGGLRGAQRLHVGSEAAQERSMHVWLHRGRW